MPTTLAVLAFWLIVRWIVGLNQIPAISTAGLVGLALGILSTLVAQPAHPHPAHFCPILRRATECRDAPLEHAGGSGRSPAARSGPGAQRLAGATIILSPGSRWFIPRTAGSIFISATARTRQAPAHAAGNGGQPVGPARVRAGNPGKILGRKLTRTEAGQYWNDLARQSIREAPLHWLGILAVKIRNYWNVFQYDDISAVTSMREAGFIAPGLHFGVVAALGLPGLLIGCGLSRRARWIAAAVVLQMVSLLPVFVTERYRLPACLAS